LACVMAIPSEALMILHRLRLPRSREACSQVDCRPNGTCSSAINLIHLNVTTSAHLRDQIQINARMRAI
jgi:hypothetical protein